MPPRRRFRLWIPIAVVLVLAAMGAAMLSARDPSSPGSGQSRRRPATSTVERRDFVRSIRLSGTVEAVDSTTIPAPRLRGPNTNSLVITRLVRAGVAVRKGDLIVEFDRQTQLAAALDRRAELGDLEQQIRKREAAERAARAKDEGEILLAESALSRAKLEILKNEMIPKIQAEKNQQALEQAEATLKQLRATFDLKRKAADADLRILLIRRDRAENAMRQAETNAERMAVTAPIDGMAVIRTTWKTETMTEIQEGEEVRAGVPVLDIVNPSKMRVRARVNQADINDLRVDQKVRVGLDAYPDLTFDGRVAQVSPIAMGSTLSPKVRVYVVLIDIGGAHPNLMPDLTASLDVELARAPGAIVVPRDALGYDAERVFVLVQRGSSFRDQDVTLGPVSTTEAVIASGLAEGAVIARHVAARSLR
ncbi:MAG TPA: HlyD family efflux transporter periplasmic adaptor subunit [Vicinamibacterales bacterium]|nr:HlyD family efflux transporter periplasmic adaptor subunit [Vicinamibacterales bacterium]